MKRILLVAALVAAVHSASADSSYLLIQGPFGISGSLETHKWKVNYNTGQIATGFDLLTAVFGPAVNTGTTIGTTPIFRSGNSQNGATYQYFASFDAYITLSFTLNGKNVAADSSGDPGWNYYVAGGTGFSPYPAGTWTFADDGTGTRGLTNQSFDGWVYGGTFVNPTATIANGTTTFAPLVANFSDATVITVVPEPGSALLVMCGAVMLWRRR